MSYCSRWSVYFLIHKLVIFLLLGPYKLLQLFPCVMYVMTKRQITPNLCDRGSQQGPFPSLLTIKLKLNLFFGTSEAIWIYISHIDPPIQFPGLGGGANNMVTHNLGTPWRHSYIHTWVPLSPAIDQSSRSRKRVDVVWRAKKNQC